MPEFNFSPFPVISTERLMLRETLDSDLQSFFKMRTDERVMKYVGRPRPKSAEELLPLLAKMREGVTNNTEISWVISLKDNPALIGQIGFWRNDPEHHRGEIGYMFLPEHFGKGYASEALNAALDYGFNAMKLHSVCGNTDPANLASQRVLEKAGFKKEAHFREDFYFDGVFHDSAIWSILVSDRANRQSR